MQSFYLSSKLSISQTTVTISRVLDFISLIWISQRCAQSDEWCVAPCGPGGRWGHQSNSDTRPVNITTLHSTQYRMIVQDISDMRDTDEQTMIVTGEFLTKMNYLLVLMGVIFTLLCLLLTVCVIM